ncbi:hypothetical protein ACNAN0_02325 [Agrilactobacillus fermenti]|uniref:hypothetical protein n=1 Tax=Agrilactobacillus fermenti TaxID=2586909 RepID=UPI001E31E73C|nr:hypothetical protein [Agrilactobacillus fermenti]MCD2257105.1 hypothetical protein [Agrilactobacillus fermenti]
MEKIEYHLDAEDSLYTAIGKTIAEFNLDAQTHTMVGATPDDMVDFVIKNIFPKFSDELKTQFEIELKKSIKLSQYESFGKNRGLNL